jgi:spore germination cell wall hydrolase CwlJ-like protein
MGPKLTLRLLCVCFGALLWVAAALLPEQPGIISASEAGPIVADAQRHVVSGTDITVTETVGPERMAIRPVRYRADVDQDLECLALNIYWEARSEPEVGKLAIAKVTLNRVGHPLFGSSICEVVYQGPIGGPRWQRRHGRYECQFSWVCDRITNKPQDDEAWRAARDIAFEAIYLGLPDPTNGSLWYHAHYVRPDWADRRHELTRIGKHIFYKRVRMKHEARSGTARS